MQYVIWLLLAGFCLAPVIVAQLVINHEKKNVEVIRKEVKAT